MKTYRDVYHYKILNVIQQKYFFKKYFIQSNKQINSNKNQINKAMRPS